MTTKNLALAILLAVVVTVLGFYGYSVDETDAVVDAADVTMVADATEAEAVEADVVDVEVVAPVETPADGSADSEVLESVDESLEVDGSV